MHGEDQERQMLTEWLERYKGWIVGQVDGGNEVGRLGLPYSLIPMF